ncbi:MAG: GspH/FimT family pseudopilin [Burkholderiaceae bacterium]|jgi:type IV fimbrial biogenesis protein FimT|nr:GspH/FimT family pseudopilin [Burkholderiaceae bacterium]
MINECPPKIKRHWGYTAIEFLVVLALIAIMMGLIVPNFSSWIDRWRVHQGIAQLQNVMRFANAQAIRTGSPVVIQSIACPQQQNTQDWSCGLRVFQDINRNNIQDAGEPTLQQVQTFRSLTVMHAGGASNARMVYWPHGAPTANPGRFEVYPATRPDSPAEQTICVSFGGRMRVKAGLGC